MNPLIKLISAGFVFGIKGLSLVLYKTEDHWLTPKDQIDWEDLRLVIALNHTSLFEPLFISVIPNYRLWRAIERLVVPIADVTMKRPLVGRLFKYFVPNCIPITRKRDETWDQYLNRARDKNSLMFIFPEGRMKRIDGLDKHGNPMSVKGGVADILAELDGGKILIAYSGGLHHVQAPGQSVPKVFKRIKVAFEQLDVQEYKASLAADDAHDFRKKVIADLEDRMHQHCKEIES
ncbi:MAG: 1-acyl-sn-glycerol-3-phosphate acyltransferase [Bdellovibrionaceae bacterium]|nr:1-acyl-sn-glycerol-3-phosphate acyltransferase [Bdellovibrionales bacterium]MCB9085180.1 1-acyl-sn-glycerol-3-phosphate acyltransferase [Pseudobdellovibrionaceae bacterium]